jgi:hypothetical protein
MLGGGLSRGAKLSCGAEGRCSGIPGADMRLAETGEGAIDGEGGGADARGGSAVVVASAVAARAAGRSPSDQSGAPTGGVEGATRAASR